MKSRGRKSAAELATTELVRTMPANDPPPPEPDLVVLAEMAKVKAEMDSL